MKTQGQPFALVTVVRCESPTSAKPGAKAIVDEQGEIHGWIGGGCAQPAVIETVKKALKDGQARLIRVSPVKGAPVEEGILDFGMTCHSGGTLDIFIDPIISRPVLLIIGGSPAAQSLSALAHRTGFAVSSVFPGASANMFPDAVEIVDGMDVSALQCGAPSFVVVATQGKHDEAGLEAALATGCGYIAFIASERKSGKLRTYLKERGHDETRVNAMISPAGIEIGAVTPEEIALSVLAGMVRARREEGFGAAQTTMMHQEDKQAGSDDKPEITEEEAVDPVCGMRVDVVNAEYRADYHDKVYYFCCTGCQHSFEKSPEKYLAVQGKAP